MRNMGAVLLAVPFALAGCGGPDLGTPESTAREYAKLRVKEFAWEVERRVEQEEERLEFASQRGEIWVGRGALNKDLDVKRAKLEFIQDHLSEIADNIHFDIVDLEDVDSNNKNVTIKFWMYEVKSAQEREGRTNPKAFYLDYDSDTEKVRLTKVSGEWRVQGQ